MLLQTFITLISFPIHSFVFGLPLSSPRATTQPQTVGYVPEPNGRGTWGLISSCVLTLVLCVWSALHLNIPAPHEPVLRTFLKNVCWIVTGIYAPELVVFVAWRQSSSAKILTSTVNSSRSKQCREMRFEWTKTHSFFACTGGFAFETAMPDRDDSQSIFPKRSPTRLTLTSRGVDLLAKCGHLPDVSEEDIEDKNKASSLAKALVVLQALWMLAQVLGRVIAKYPVTLLEVNTVAHVFCALGMYSLWWYKPLLPNEPFVITGDWVEPLCAYMYLCSEISGSDAKHEIEAQTRVKRLFVHFHFYNKAPEIEGLCFRQNLERNLKEEMTPLKDAQLQVEKLECAPAQQECLEGIRAKASEKHGDTAFFERRPRLKNSAPDEPSDATLRRWKLALEAIQTYPVLQQPEDYCYTYVKKEVICFHPKPQQYLVRNVPNWPSEDLLRDFTGLMVGVTLWAANFLYGGLHALAWNNFFPSTVEKWLWRSTAIYISFCGGLWVLLNGIVSKLKKLNAFWEHWMDGEKSWLSDVFLGSLVCLCGSAFILARAFIVVEAFVSIRELPVMAYDTPSWSQIWPHL